MTTIEEQTTLLDRLQNEINSVLENTGRLFAAARVGNKAAPAAQAARLKRDLPGSIGRFHDALDQLEDEIETARNVMRRDLALVREQSSAPQEEQKSTKHDNAALNGQVSPHDVVAADMSAEPTHDQQTDKVEEDVDIVMQDTAKAGEAETEAEAEAEAPAQNEVPLKPSTPPASVIQDSGDGTAKESASAAEASPTQHPSEEKNDIGDHIDKSSDTALHLDTSRDATQPLPQQVPEVLPSSNDGKEEGSPSERPPDTGTFSNNADLDSLFNDPASAGGASGDALSFGLPTGNSTGAQEFDFGAFNASLDQNPTATVDGGNDDLNNLLPGLSEYANTQPLTGGGSTEVDFDALFAPVANDTGSGHGNEGDQQQGGTGAEQRDSTFDDLMDFGDFGNSGAGDGGTNDNQDFDFSFD